jgi:hypothetical protein
MQQKSEWDFAKIMLRAAEGEEFKDLRGRSAGISVKNVPRQQAKQR